MNVRTGFNIDYSPTRNANRLAAEQIINRGNIKANAIQARDRGLESGLGKVLGAALFGVPGLADGLVGGGSGLSLDETKNVLADASREAAVGRAIDPDQLLSANNLVDKAKTEYSEYKSLLKQLFG